jgi:hypothetical protein
VARASAPHHEPAPKRRPAARRRNRRACARPLRATDRHLARGGGRRDIKTAASPTPRTRRAKSTNGGGIGTRGFVERETDAEESSRLSRCGKPLHELGNSCAGLPGHLCSSPPGVQCPEEFHGPPPTSSRVEQEPTGWSIHCACAAPHLGAKDFFPPESFEGEGVSSRSTDATETTPRSSPSPFRRLAQALGAVSFCRND